MEPWRRWTTREGRRRTPARTVSEPGLRANGERRARQHSYRGAFSTELALSCIVLGGMWFFDRLSVSEVKPEFQQLQGAGPKPFTWLASIWRLLDKKKTLAFSVSNVIIFLIYLFIFFWGEKWSEDPLHIIITVVFND